MSTRSAKGVRKPGHRGGEKVFHLGPFVRQSVHPHGTIYLRRLYLAHGAVLVDGLPEADDFDAALTQPSQHLQNLGRRST